MKKLLALLLSILLILGMLSGCVSDSEDDEEEETKKSSSKKDTEETEETEEEEEVVPPVQTGYVRGTSDSSGWKSEYLGIQFSATSSMIMSTEEEMFEIMQLGLEYINGNSQQIDFSTLDNVYEMMAVDLNNNNVIVMALKLPLANMTEETYAVALKQNLEGQTAFNYVVSDPYEVTFCGKTCIAMDSEATVSGVTVGQCYIIMKVNDRMYTIAISSATEGFLETALSCFSPC